MILNWRVVLFFTIPVEVNVRGVFVEAQIHQQWNPCAWVLLHDASPVLHFFLLPSSRLDLR